MVRGSLDDFKTFCGRSINTSLIEELHMELIKQLREQAGNQIGLIITYDEGVCLYCGGTLNRDFEGDEYDEGYSPDWCPNCCKNIDPYDDWDQACLDAIDKVIHDEPFEA